MQTLVKESEKSGHEMTSPLAMSVTPRLFSVRPENPPPRAKQCAGSWLQASLYNNNPVSLTHFILRWLSPKNWTRWRLCKWPRPRYHLFVWRYWSWSFSSKVKLTFQVWFCKWSGQGKQSRQITSFSPTLRELSMCEMHYGQSWAVGWDGCGLLSVLFIENNAKDEFSQD